MCKKYSSATSKLVQSAGQERGAAQVMEEKVTDVNVDIATIAPQYHLFTQTEVAEVLGRV